MLTQQPDPVREFLLHTAVLDRLTGPLCDAVTGRDDGSQLLITLERANLFLVPLDDRREWYRYHHLFADVLRAHLLAERPDLVPLLHQRASLWYERHDLTEEAVRHALAARGLRPRGVPDGAGRAGDPPSPAGSGAVRLAAGTARRRRPAQPGAQRLLRIHADGLRRPRRVRGPTRRRGTRVGRRTRRADSPWADTEELQTLPATIAIYRASLAQARGDVAGTAEHARRALDFAGPDDHLARGGALGFLGLAAWATGDVSGALETFTQAVASLHAAGNLVDELSSTVPLADMWLAAGRPSRARRLYQDALRLAEAHGGGVARATAELHVGVSEIDLEIGDLESAKRELQTAAALGEPASMSEGRYRWFLAMGRVADAEGDPLEAITLLDQAQQLYLPGLFPDVRPIPAVKARVWISRGDLSQAADWAQERGVSATDDANYLHEFDHLTLVRLLIAQYRADHDTDVLDQAAGLLDRLADAAETSGRAGSLLEIRMLQALAHDAQGHRAQALQSLAQAWAEAPEPDGYVRLFLDEGAPMVELLREAEQLGDAGGHARRLLTRRAARDGEATESPLRPALSLALPSAESLSERELQVLRLLDSELSGPQIARELFVSNNTLRTHTKHIFTKLDVTNRRAAVRRAREEGLI